MVIKIFIFLVTFVALAAPLGVPNYSAIVVTVYDPKTGQMLVRDGIDFHVIEVTNQTEVYLDGKRTVVEELKQGIVCDFWIDRAGDCTAIVGHSKPKSKGKELP